MNFLSTSYECFLKFELWNSFKLTTTCLCYVLTESAEQINNRRQWQMML